MPKKKPQGIPHTHHWILVKTTKKKDGGYYYHYKCFCKQTVVTEIPL